MVFLEVESLQLLPFCSSYFVSTVFPSFLVLKQPAFYWVGCRGQEHTHRVNFYLGETNIMPGYEQAICTVLAFSSVPDEFLRTPRDNLHRKNYCSLGQYATTFPWAAHMSETLHMLFVFPPLQLTSLLSAKQIYFTLFPLFTLKSCLQS